MKKTEKSTSEDLMKSMRQLMMESIGSDKDYFSHNRDSEEPSKYKRIRGMLDILENLKCMNSNKQSDPLFNASLVDLIQEKIIDRINVMSTQLVEEEIKEFLSSQEGKSIVNSILERELSILIRKMVTDGSFNLLIEKKLNLESVLSYNDLKEHILQVAKGYILSHLDSILQ